ncbi:uncharacterized protein SPAPADRAFT_52876 [Spathaspora passalidarum NRRL Y-27907]|uniref:Trafficking protein particle complex subunit 11 domain-containing protein n=1 Tax=Spathaspora passalidarum (strain NRRL Y-27907 / 11-Y1) TaxID=619300 RepID=G3AUU5_SPAPN|nr:uncharacterized protein SPAPADRAFT_52876 [Spathaspora passalidarum NRRL Y-27907]EGW30036.1 hypothetical protein SPAPADRAFT_52876 [Spathaspora passalidarum NRRL Y-27907]
MSTTKFIIEFRQGSSISIAKEQKNDHHSILSPFNPLSKLFPNGIINSDWFDKYINHIPFAVVYIIQGDDNVLNKINAAEATLKPLGITPVVLLVDGDSVIDYVKLNTSVIVYTFESDPDSIKLLMAQLMHISHDFYANIEAKIKQRYKKYYTTVENDTVDTNVELTPKFLEVRNLIKQGMIAQFMNSSDLTTAIRLLELAYDILLGLLPATPHELPHDIELTTQFKTLLDILCFHIVRGYFSIEEPLKAFKFHKLHIIHGDTNNDNWISLQYHWLAELVHTIPSAITTISKTKRTPPLTTYFGGVHLSQFDIISDASLLLVKAYESIKNGDHQQKIKLLQKALSWFDGLSSFIEYINWLLAEEYYTINEYAKAIDHYKLIHATNFILYKLLQCYLHTDDTKLALTSLVKLSLLSYKPVPQISFEKSLEIDLLDEDQLFSVDVLIFGNDQVYVRDEVTLQIVLHSNSHLSRLVKGNVDITINQVDVIVTSQGKHKGMKSISITHDNNKPITKLAKLHGQELDESFVDSMNLQFTDKSKIIHHLQTMTNSGTFEIECIKLQTTIKITSEHTITLNKIELHNTFVPHHHHTTIYQDHGKYNKRLTTPGNIIKVLPVRPTISITLLKDLQSYILGERLVIPLKIEFPNQDNKSVKLTAKVKGDVTWNWHSLKDDEPLLLQTGSDNYQLHVFTRTPQELLSVDLTAMVDDDEEVLVYDVASYVFPIMRKSPFACDYLISPSYRDSTLDMPSPFVVTDTAMPVTTRLWQGKLDINDEFRLEIVNIEYTIISSNPEIEVNVLSSSKEMVLFTTRAKSGGFNLRNVNVVTSSTIKWRRDEHSPVNDYTTPEWEVTLPLSDPRLLLVPKADADSFTLNYILENPTPRIFTFTTLLTFEDWSFEDQRNIVPIKQNPFPVLPFSRHHMIFYGKYTGEEKDEIKLPLFKVFDVQYKVGLPTLACSKETIVKSGDVYWKCK